MNKCRYCKNLYKCLGEDISKTELECNLKCNKFELTKDLKGLNQSPIEQEGK